MFYLYCCQCCPFGWPRRRPVQPLDKLPPVQIQHSCVVSVGESGESAGEENPVVHRGHGERVADGVLLVGDLQDVVCLPGSRGVYSGTEACIVITETYLFNVLLCVYFSVLALIKEYKISAVTRFKNP